MKEEETNVNDDKPKNHIKTSDNTPKDINHAKQTSNEKEIEEQVYYSPVDDEEENIDELVEGYIQKDKLIKENIVELDKRYTQKDKLIKENEISIKEIDDTMNMCHFQTETSEEEERIESNYQKETNLQSKENNVRDKKRQFNREDTIKDERKLGKGRRKKIKSFF